MITDRAPDGPNLLTQVEAQQRAAQISDAAYDLALSLRAGAPDYEGDVTIRFRLKDPSAGTFLDFTGKEILRLDVNDAEVTDARWDSHHLDLDGALLRDENVVRIVYRNDYDHEGVGLHQFIDPEDGAEYLYTQFEPYEAHRLFPCFDQPDIKARYRLRVAAPSQWAVVTNYPETASGPTDGDRTVREFRQTEPFSPYLVALVAGPFHRFDDAYGDTPLAIYCRESLAKHMDPDEFFEITKQGLQFFGEFFDFPYPFAKYDQLFVPEFNFGAMENVGCVTFNERMVFRDPPTELQRLNRAEVLLHEMAHMWFGDLVTMQWWNDIWLNESFATYMAYLSLHDATRFQAGAWPAFHAGMKAWAYQQDQLVTTHPISSDTPDTDATFLNFDGISYGKGASVLKQLVAAIGPDGFRDGLRHYFKTYAWGNTTLEQFLGALETGSGRDLQRWAELWLETAGVNTLTPVWSATDGRVDAFRLEQSAPADHPTLRPHRLDLAVFDEGAGGAPTLREVIPLEIDGAQTVIETMVGAAAPAAVFPNEGDHAFAKIALDEKSLAFVRDRLERFDDPLTRLLLWHSLWEMVRDQQFRSIDYLALVRDKLRYESDLELMSTVIGNALTAVSRYVPEPQRLAEAATLFEFCEQQMRAADEQDFRIDWARALISSAQDADRVRALLAIVDGGTGIDGFELDQDMRWSTVVKAAAYDIDGAAQRIDAERERDPSDRGQRAIETAQTSVPDAAKKAASWERYKSDEDSSLYILRSSMQGFFWTHQLPLVGEYIERFFDDIRGVVAARDKDYATTYFRSLYPSFQPGDEVIERSQALIAQLDDDDILLRRYLREALDEVQRSKACRTFATT